jgi:hypothetical protein
MPLTGQYVQILDPSGNVVDFTTGNITSLGNLTITSSALPSGAATQATLAAIATATGTIADAAWSGTGNATIISLLKAIALK